MLLGLLVTAFLAPDAPLILLIDGSAIGHFYCPSTGKIRDRPEQR